MPSPRHQGSPLPLPAVLLSVLVGGTAGGAARHLAATSHASVLAVNLAGSLLLGLLVVTLPHHWRPLLGTGFCGGLTTFGTVAVVSDQWVGDGRVGLGAGFLAANLVGGCLAAGAGVALGHRLSRRAELAPEDPDLEVE